MEGQTISCRSPLPGQTSARSAGGADPWVPLTISSPGTLRDPGPGLRARASEASQRGGRRALARAGSTQDACVIHICVSLCAPCPYMVSLQFPRGSPCSPPRSPAPSPHTLPSYSRSPEKHFLFGGGLLSLQAQVPRTPGRAEV